MRNRSRADAPDLARQPNRATYRERADVGTVVGAQDYDRSEAVRRDVAGRLAEIDAQTREQSRQAVEVDAEARKPRPVRLGGLTLATRKR